MFNISQLIDDLPKYCIKQIEKLEKINKEIKIDVTADKYFRTYLKNSGVKKVSGNKAGYSLTKDKIIMPAMAKFKTKDSFYATFGHEIVHSTGSKDRLNRNLSSIKDEKKYSKEELVAEYGSAMLNSMFSLKVDIDNSTAYIKGWLKALDDDPNMLINGSSKAHEAVKYIKEVVTVDETKVDNKVLIDADDEVLIDTNDEVLMDTDSETLFETLINLDDNNDKENGIYFPPF